MLSLGRIGGDRWPQAGLVYQGKCCRDDCKQANRCRSQTPQQCVDYPACPSYPVPLKHQLDRVFF
jgi:hypothetical protein